MNEYIIRGGASGKARLGVIGRALAPTTRPLLQRAGIREGATGLDVGCGGGDVVFEMARLVGPAGRVVGVDVDEEKLRLAQGEAVAQRLTHVEFRAVDLRTWTADAKYDISYARFVLTHLHDAPSALQQMMASTTAGGSVVIEDIDYHGNFAYPPCAALDRHVAIYRDVVRRRGGGCGHRTETPQDAD